jgi:hypothetical protein
MKVKGKIISIGETQTFDSGAKKLSFQIDTGETYNNILSFDLFKGVEHLEHLTKFGEYNKVGDSVEVEFNIQCKEHNGKYYTNLQMWRCDKVGAVNAGEMPEDFRADAEDSLPF